MCCGQAGLLACGLEGFGDKMASAYVILRHFREIATAIKMPAEAATRWLGGIRGGIFALT